MTVCIVVRPANDCASGVSCAIIDKPLRLARRRHPSFRRGGQIHGLLTIFCQTCLVEAFPNTPKLRPRPLPPAGVACLAPHWSVSPARSDARITRAFGEEKSVGPEIASKSEALREAYGAVNVIDSVCDQCTAVGSTAVAFFTAFGHIQPVDEPLREGYERGWRCCLTCPLIGAHKLLA